MNTAIYNVPLAQAANYRDQRLVVRTDDPVALVVQWPVPPVHWFCVQLTGLPTDTGGLVQWGENIAIDIVLDNPIRDYPRLYRYAKLVDNHPVRVSLPVVAGVDKVVRLASSLQFAVKLQPAQPQPALFAELAGVLDYYLHHTTVPQPVDYFHEILLGWVHDTPADLWTVLDEDPAVFRYISDSGAESFAPRLSGAGGDADGFVQRWLQALIESAGECRDCAYREVCRGYFKWPQQDYDCSGVKQLFATLHSAAGELKQALFDHSVITGDGDVAP
jgi:hypothetical protein